MTSIFCDDVRAEQGNKFSYMGIYNGTLLLAQFPTTLSKLCVVMSVYCHGMSAHPKTLSFNLYKDDELLHQIHADMGQQAQKAFIPEGKRATMTYIMQFHALPLTEPCIFKVRALCDGEEIKGGILHVDIEPAANNQNPTTLPQPFAI